MKRSAVLSAILLGLSSLTHADEVLTAQERMAFTLLNSILDIVSARINTSSCNELKGQYRITLFATGNGDERRENNLITVELSNQAVSVIGYPKDIVPEFGSMILAGYAAFPASNTFDVVVKDYSASYTFNSTGELVTTMGDVALKNRYLATQLLYKTGATTSFNRSLSSDPEDLYASNIGWGMSRLSTPEYPKSKYWQRLKISRDDGTNAETFFVRDLLAYRQSCRIKIDMSGHNSADNIAQEGHLIIDMSSPHDPVGISFE